MKPKPSPTPVHLSAPCQACTGPHRLRECDTPEAAALLESAGLVMSASEVRRRIAVKGGAS